MTASRPRRLPTMPMTPLGGSGPSVSRMALGTMTFGAETDQADAHGQLDLFIEAGGSFVDTADVYAGGESERIVGRWLADRRANVVLATKGRFGAPPGSPGASRRSMTHSIDASLSRLGVESIDVYLVHGWDQLTPVDETLDVLSGMVRAGKIQHIGWSNVTGWQLQQILTTAHLGGFVAPIAMQPQYNLLDRGVELEVLPCCLDNGVALTPWSPLGGGWLTGKYTRRERPTGPTRLGEDPDRGVEAYDARDNDRTWRILDVVSSIAERHQRPMSHVALAWLLGRPSVASVLLGARTVAQLVETLAATDLELTDDEQRALTDASAPGLPPYPYGMVEEWCAVEHWKALGTADAGA